MRIFRNRSNEFIYGSPTTGRTIDSLVLRRIRVDQGWTLHLSLSLEYTHNDTTNHRPHTAVRHPFPPAPSFVPSLLSSTKLSFAICPLRFLCSFSTRTLRSRPRRLIGTETSNVQNFQVQPYRTSIPPFRSPLVCLNRLPFLAEILGCRSWWVLLYNLVPSVLRLYLSSLPLIRRTLHPTHAKALLSVRTDCVNAADEVRAKKLAISRSLRCGPSTLS